jgi:response regulator NasT
LRVLVAEDETLIRLDLRQMLEQHGMEVCGEARDGLEAVELARQTLPDVAVFDLKMPNLDGVEAARRVYAERPIPILMLTAYSDRQTVDRAIGAGVFAYISKPFGPQDVIPAIRAAVIRHADLLAARREVGKRDEPIEVELTSSTGQVWPLRIRRKADGSVAVDMLPE